MTKFHAVIAIKRGKTREDEVLYHGSDASKAGTLYEKAILDPKFEEVGLALNVPYIRTCCPRAQAVNAAAIAEKSAIVSEVKAPEPETTLKGKSK